MLKLYYLQRRRDRYTLIYVWKILESIVPNLNIPITCYNSIRRGRLCATSHVGIGHLGTLVYHSDTDDEWKEDLETWFGVMNHPSDFVRDFCRAVVSSDVELYHGTFARWITSLAEPRVRAKRPWKPAPVAGQSRKVKRQEAYRSLQALWSSRRSRACNSALDATWSDTGISHQSNDELATFWRGVFEAEDSGEPRPGPAEPTLSELIKPITMPELVRVIGKMSVSALGPDRVSLKRLRT